MRWLCGLRPTGGLRAQNGAKNHPKKHQKIHGKDSRKVVRVIQERASERFKKGRPRDPAKIQKVVFPGSAFCLEILLQMVFHSVAKNARKSSKKVVREIQEKSSDRFKKGRPRSLKKIQKVFPKLCTKWCPKRGPAGPRRGGPVRSDKSGPIRSGPIPP